MAERRIHLTESQLYGLVEQTINELDWKTYMNAAGERIAQGNDAYDEPGVDYYKRKDNGNVLYSKADALARHATKALTDKHGVDTEEDGWVLFPKGIANKHPMTAGKHSRKAPYRKSSLLANGEEIHDNSHFEPYNPEDPDMKDVINYQKGKSKYIPGKGWNESIVRKVTEKVMRLIKESTDDYDEGYMDDEDIETPKVETYTDLLEHGLTPEIVLTELEARLSADERNELMDGMWRDYDMEYNGIRRRDYKYLRDLVDSELFKPTKILEFADQFFGKGKTREGAQRMMDLLWNN